MKTTLKPVIFLTLFSILFFTQCKKNKNELPSETQEGKNTFGCLVNGKVFRQGTSAFNSMLNTQYIYSYPALNGYYLQMQATNNAEECNTKSIRIWADSMSISEGVVIPLGKNQRGSASAEYLIQSCGVQNLYTISNANSGEIYIKKFDQVNQIISGSFWFNGINSISDTIHITQGRFDLRYTR